MHSHSILHKDTKGFRIRVEEIMLTMLPFRFNNYGFILCPKNVLKMIPRKTNFITILYDYLHIN